ncbi:MAG: flagellar brake protein [Bacillota bacterium]|nr:flagellar brake protein [Bacillota bacterium]
MLEYELKSKIEVFSVENELIGNSTLMDFNENALFISAPMLNSIIKNLKIGSEIKIVYYTKKKIFGFYSVIRSEVIDNIVLYEIDTPKEFSVVQRRKFVRIPVIFEMKYITLEQGEAFSSDLTVFEDVERYYGNRIKNCMAVDLSGEGIGMVVKEDLKINDKMIIILENSQINVVVLGKVRRKKKLKNSEYSYRLGIQFIDIGNTVKEKIIQYVFKKMRDQLKSYTK